MALIEGKKRDDILYGTEETDTIYGYGGDDYLSSSGSASQLDNDRLYGGDGNDIIYAAGAATFSVINDPAYDLNWAENAYAARAHVLDGGAGNDYISTGGSVGAVDGGDGYDVLEFGDVVQISGGGRVEVGYVEWSLTGMAVDLGAGAATFAGATTTIRFYTDRDNTSQTVLHTTVPPANFGAFTQSIAGIEAVVGSRFDDTLTGSDRTDVAEVFDIGAQAFYGHQTGTHYSRGPDPDTDRIVGKGGTDIVSALSCYNGIVANLATGTLTVNIVADSFYKGLMSGGDTAEFSGVEGVYGSNTVDSLTGDGGDNVFNGRGGADTIDGGEGFDTLDYGYHGIVSRWAGLQSGSLGVVVDLDGGTATDDWGAIDTIKNIEAAYGTLFADTMTGDDGRNHFDGSDGKDTLIGAGGIDAIHGGDDDDTISGGDELDKLWGDAGKDKVSGDDGQDQIRGGDGDDTLDGGDGDDRLWGGKDNDTLNGGDENDQLRGEAGNDTVNGSAGNDALDGGAGNDVLDGGAGDDTLVGGDGADEMLGGKGSDSFEVGDGADSYDGGAGIDSLTLIKVEHGGNVDLAKGTMSGKGIGNDTITAIENVFGSDFADKLFGDGKVNRFYGFDGNDAIDGGGGNDLLFGGAGKDLITGGDGNDKLFGDTETPGTEGKAGNDTLKGGEGDDEILGGGGKDNLQGQGGRDTLDGGGGDDQLIGGGDADVFVLSRGKDVIRDFKLGKREFGETGVHNPKAEDRLDVSDFGISDLEELGEHLRSSEAGPDAEFVFGSDSVTLQGTSWLKLDAIDFIFG
jgi:Ca2+-binding RTX toxin-like protein